jgi:hypothetical protein
VKTKKNAFTVDACEIKFTIIQLGMERFIEMIQAHSYFRSGL